MRPTSRVVQAAQEYIHKVITTGNTSCKWVGAETIKTEEGRKALCGIVLASKQSSQKSLFHAAIKNYEVELLNLILNHCVTIPMIELKGVLRRNVYLPDALIAKILSYDCNHKYGVNLATVESCLLDYHYHPQVCRSLNHCKKAIISS